MPDTAKPADPSPTMTLTDDSTGRRYVLPVLEGTLGPKVVDIRRLYPEAGFFTYDPAFTSTASCVSNITFIDGDKGQLLHRGYAIEELAMHCSFMEVAYLLLHGELPNQVQKDEFQHTITMHTMIHDQLNYLYRGFRRDAHPMAIMVGVVGAMSAFYHDSTNIRDPRQREIASYRLLAKTPTIAAFAYKYHQGQPFMYPHNQYGYSENFLHMVFATPCEPYPINPVAAAAIRRIFILHADHEQNASTSTVRLAGSSAANPFACISAGIASLWGPAHGGANEAVIRMLDEIGDDSHIGQYIDRAKDKNDPFRLMGFGHRVYRNYDPRARVMRQTCYEVLDAFDKHDDPQFSLAMKLEKIALEDQYFIERKLYPNVDFYSGIILKALGFPLEMFTVIFAVARTIGWLAQWKEMIEEPHQRIGRPRQLYIGQQERPFVPIEQR